MNSQKQSINTPNYQAITNISFDTNNNTYTISGDFSNNIDYIYIPLNTPITIQRGELYKINLDSYPEVKDAYTYIAYLVENKFDYYKYPLFIKSMQTNESETFNTIRVKFFNGKLMPYFTTLSCSKPFSISNYVDFKKQQVYKITSLEERKTLMNLDQVRTIEVVGDLICVNNENHKCRKYFVFKHECSFTIDNSIKHGETYQICLLHVGKHTFNIIVENENLNKQLSTLCSYVNKKGYLSFKVLK